MTQPEGLVIDWKPAGTNGTVVLTARVGTENLAVDTVEIASATERQRFEDGLCNDRHGIDRPAVRQRLMDIAADHLRRECRADPDDPSVVNVVNVVTPPPEPECPDPPDAAAYHGLPGDIVRAIEPHTEADPVAVLVQILVSFGNVIGRKAHFVAEADRHFCNLFVGIVGKSSKGRKGTSLGQSLRPFGGVDEAWVTERRGSNMGSGEGLIWAVRNPITKRVPVKTRGRFTGEYDEFEEDPGVGDKRLLVVESELASALKVMGREGNILSPIVRQAWETGNLQTMTKNSPAVSTNAHISIIGHITRDELKRELNRTEVANGFANRIQWYWVKRSKSLPDGGRLHEVDFGPLTNRLRRAVEFARDVDVIKRDDEASRLWHAVYYELSEGKPGMFGAVTGRAEAQVMRLACIYALMDRSDVVGAEHLTAALALWEYSEASVRHIFGDSLGDPVADELLRALRANPQGLTRTQIRDTFGRNKGGPDIDRALRLLVEHGLAHYRQKQTAGRAAEVWFATQRATTKTTKTTEGPRD